MKIDLYPEIGERERCFIQISKFSFTAYPVQINYVFHCLPDAANSPNLSRDLRRNVLSHRISQLHRWACGKSMVAPAAGNLSVEQAVP